MKKFTKIFIDGDMPKDHPMVGNMVIMTSGTKWVVNKVEGDTSVFLIRLRWYHRLWWWFKWNFKPCYI
jgi:hypothetical protein